MLLCRCYKEQGRVLINNLWLIVSNAHFLERYLSSAQWSLTKNNNLYDIKSFPTLACTFSLLFMSLWMFDTFIADFPHGFYTEFSGCFRCFRSLFRCCLYGSFTSGSQGNARKVAFLQRRYRWQVNNNYTCSGERLAIRRC